MFGSLLRGGCGPQSLWQACSRWLDLPLHPSDVKGQEQGGCGTNGSGGMTICFHQQMTPMIRTSLTALAAAPAVPRAAYTHHPMPLLRLRLPTPLEQLVEVYPVAQAC